MQVIDCWQLCYHSPGTKNELAMSVVALLLGIISLHPLLPAKAVVLTGSWPSHGALLHSEPSLRPLARWLGLGGAVIDVPMAFLLSLLTCSVSQQRLLLEKPLAPAIGYKLLFSLPIGSFSQQRLQVWKPLAPAVGYKLKRGEDLGLSI